MSAMSPRRLPAFAALILIGVARPGASSAAQTPADDPGTRAVLAKLREKSPAMEKVLTDAAGYAIFPSVGKAGIGIGGAYGKGVVYAGGRKIGRATLSQLSVGLQLGGQKYSEIVIFKDEASLTSFKRGKLKLDAQASAIALDERVGADLPYRDGVAIITMAKGGLMYEASVGGQKFSFRADAASARKRP
jgi:lipid-binding SYLF domain-containing protein